MELILLYAFISLACFLFPTTFAGCLPRPIPGRQLLGHATFITLLGTTQRLRNNQIFLRRVLKGTTASKIAIRKMIKNFVQSMILLR